MERLYVKKSKKNVLHDIHKIGIGSVNYKYWKIVCHVCIVLWCKLQILLIIPFLGTKNYNAHHHNAFVYS